MPKAFEREAGLGNGIAHELLRSALAEGKIVAILRMLSGQRYEIPQRMWDKDRVAMKVYPRFRDGWMRMGLNELSGPYVEGWIFVPKGSIERIFKRDQKNQFASDSSPSQRSVDGIWTISPDMINRAPALRVRTISWRPEKSSITIFLERPYAVCVANLHRTIGNVPGHADPAGNSLPAKLPE